MAEYAVAMKGIEAVKRALQASRSTILRDTVSVSPRSHRRP
jgi:hypothetical protein